MKTELGITKGTWKLAEYGNVNISNNNGRMIATTGVYSTNMDNGEHVAENEANAKLISDAGTTANATGLLPSELLAQRDALKSYLNELKRVLSIETEMNINAGRGLDWSKYTDEIEELLKKTK